MKLILVVLVSLCTTIADQDGNSVRGANIKFSDDVAEKLLKKDGNLVFSPFSAHAALSMLYQGAGGTTKEALAAALHLPDPAETAQAYDIVLSDLNSDNQQMDVKVANKVYAISGYTLKPEFGDALKNSFHSDVQALNFGETVEAANKINTWVEDNTNNKIHELIQADDLSVDTRIVIINAFYFKGSWLYPFDEEYTEMKDFNVDATTTVQVPMMSTSGRFAYVKSDKYEAEILGLPFANTNYTFLIILPIKSAGADSELSKLTMEDLLDLAQEGTTTEVDLFLPKFKLSQTNDMEDILGEMGLSELFDTGRCDLTNMFIKREDIYVSKAIQKTYIDVNELGCEAAAASALIGTGRSMHRTVAVDRPFLFAIVHKSEHKFTDVLLMGRVVNPANNEV